MTDLSITREGRVNAQLPERARLQHVAQQFEEIFVRQLLTKPELGAEPEDELGMFEPTSAQRQMGSLHTGALAERSAGALGIADLLVEHIARQHATGGEHG